MKTLKHFLAFLKYLYTAHDKRVWVWVVLAFSLVIGIGAITQGAVWFGVGVIVVMNGMFKLGSYMNFIGKEF